MGGKTETSKIAEKTEKTSAVDKKTEKTTAVKKTAAKNSVKAKKPVAGIDENGTFRAWDNAKTKAKPKKTEEKTPAKRGISAEQTAKALAATKAIDPSLKTKGKKLAAYDDSQIKHLDALEHIRLRSGMYIGRLGDGSNQNDGIYVLLKEVIDNSIDEFIVGFGNRIDIQIVENRVKVRDYGRGIPLGKVVECVSQINTGAKYNDDVFQFSVGMNGVGTKAVNALSSYFKVIAIRDGYATEAVFERGKLVAEKNTVKL